jgi:hypothetical protein
MSHPDLPEIPDKPLGSTPAPTTSAAGEATPEDVLRYYLNREESRLSSDSRSHDASAIEALRSALSSLAALREQRDGWKKIADSLAAQNAEQDDALKQKDEALRYSRGCVEFCNGAQGLEVVDKALAIKPDFSALNAVIEVATAKQDLPTAATLSASEQPRKETCDARRVIGGIIIPSAPPLGVIDALRAFVTAVYNYEETGVWPDNGTIRLLAEQGKDALEGIGRNLYPGSPSEHATGVGAKAEFASTGAPSGQTAGVASQKAGQP